MGNNTIIFNTQSKIENFNIFGKVVGVGTDIDGITASFPTIEVKYCRISELLRGIGCYGISAENIFMNNLLGGISTSGQPGKL